MRTYWNKSTTLLFQTYKNQKCNDSEYFKWFLVRYSNPAGHHSAIITNADSSSVNEVIRAILNSLFFYEKISHLQKGKKRTNANKNKKGSVFMHLKNI